MSDRTDTPQPRWPARENNHPQYTVQSRSRTLYLFRDFLAGEPIDTLCARYGTPCLDPFFLVAQGVGQTRSACIVPPGLLAAFYTRGLQGVMDHQSVWLTQVNRAIDNLKGAGEWETTQTDSLVLGA
ncbi:MAG: hypothetical protein AWU57_219 [Marinobacter sp. T13-3]|nr:MAG: hypothetical protein AWU57_219 [Marinobacter sp. T13-3]